jgi:hypothetical protein
MNDKVNKSEKKTVEEWINVLESVTGKKVRCCFGAESDVFRENVTEDVFKSIYKDTGCELVSLEEKILTKEVSAKEISAEEVILKEFEEIAKYSVCAATCLKIQKVISLSDEATLKLMVNNLVQENHNIMNELVRLKGRLCVHSGSLLRRD